MQGCELSDSNLQDVYFLKFIGECGLSMGPSNVHKNTVLKVIKVKRMLNEGSTQRDTHGINFNGIIYNILRYADDTVLFAGTEKTYHY